MCLDMTYISIVSNNTFSCIKSYQWKSEYEDKSVSLLTGTNEISHLLCMAVSPNSAEQSIYNREMQKIV